MLNKLLSFLRRYHLVQPGDHVICAVSGGADSVALLFAMYLLKEKLDIRLSAAHFNHHLRGQESDRDETFVRDFCQRYDIELYTGEGNILPGKKGLEAAARDARYGFLRSLPGKVATAHTADDNAETILMHMVRGTGLKGLGGIAPVNGNVIRPMLSVTRQDVEAFLEEWGLDCVEDSSNGTDVFLRNRLRHHVMPLLKQENPSLAVNLSEMALGLRQDEHYLTQESEEIPMEVPSLRKTHGALRSRALERFLRDTGVREPEKVHIARMEELVFSGKPSARANFPGGITIARNYDALEICRDPEKVEPQVLTCPGEVVACGYRITASPADGLVTGADMAAVAPVGSIQVRPRQEGDKICLSGGTKSLKKLYIDRKIPASSRCRIPVIVDESGVLGVCGIGFDRNRVATELPAVQIKIEEITKEK